MNEIMRVQYAVWFKLLIIFKL